MDTKQTPALRFKGFAGEWETKKLSDIASKVTTKNVDLKVQETFTNSAEFGVISQQDFFDHSISNAENIGGYYVVETEDFVYNPRISATAPVGPINKNKLGRSGIMSPLYTVFRTQSVDNTYLEWFFKGTGWHAFMQYNGDSGARSDRFSIKNELFFEMPIPLPSLEEQKEIGACFARLDAVLALARRRAERLAAVKRAMLAALFPKEGKTLPALRFQGFSGEWQRKRFGDLVKIERGGSPRPIEAFITDAPNGLNWVKIGDAPTSGNYITKTAERIKPEGLSKTRQVYPGDLVLSNSMSFGRPYIMGIQGCIHDGWLLIRDEQKIFDLKFLCCLLGSEQMLTQYQSMASGSTVNNLNKELVSRTIVCYPSIEEQRVLGEYFDKFDEIISLQARRTEKLTALKKALLGRMFV